MITTQKRHPYKVIALLGGSFNPAHDGHVHISKQALMKVGVDEVWWLVSPQNPLKSSRHMASYAERFASASALTRSQPAIKVSDYEARAGTRYTIDTLRALQRAYPHYRFIWLMGADNLVQFHRWKHWRAIASLMPIAVFDRSPSQYSALRSQAASALHYAKIPESCARLLAHLPAPAWCYLHIPRSTLSSTQIRKNLEKDPK